MKLMYIIRRTKSIVSFNVNSVSWNIIPVNSYFCLTKRERERERERERKARKKAS